MRFNKLIHPRFDSALRWASALLAVSLLVGSAARVHATPIPGLYNTGVDNSNALLPLGTVDPHYKLIASDDAAFPIPNAHVSNPRPASWIANSTTSQWISPNTIQGAPGGQSPIIVGDVAGTYIYELTFDLTGFIPGQTSISGNWATDDIGLIFLNTTYVGGTTNLAGPGSLPSFSIPVGSNFVSGINHLDFVVVNGGVGNTAQSATGLRIENITGTSNPTPEPSTVILAGMGVIGLVFARLRQRRRS